MGTGHAGGGGWEEEVGGEGEGGGEGGRKWGGRGKGGGQETHLRDLSKP